MEEFKIGAKVGLISGGPEMTVIELSPYIDKGLAITVRDDNYVKCQWWDGKAYFKDTFPKEALEILK